MLDAFQVESGQLRSAGTSVEDCCRRLETGRKSDAAGGVSAGLAGFAVAGACEAAGKKSTAAFSGVAKSWRAWSAAAAGGATRYEQDDVGNEAVIRGAGLVS